MERDRLKTLFWPFGNRFDKYYNRFEQRTQNLDKSAIEQQLSAPTYRHRLRDMSVRCGVGFLIAFGVSKLIPPASESTLLHAMYLISLGPQALAIALQSATRSIMIQSEQRILQKELARR